jgi:hypothetical protein
MLLFSSHSSFEKIHNCFLFVGATLCEALFELLLPSSDWVDTEVYPYNMNEFIGVNLISQCFPFFSKVQFSALK